MINENPKENGNEEYHHIRYLHIHKTIDNDPVGVESGLVIKKRNIVVKNRTKKLFKFQTMTNIISKKSSSTTRQLSNTCYL